MAGFYIVGMALMVFIIVMIIMFIFEVISILSIVFSALSLSKSKKYISLGGRYDYRSVRRFHTAAVVFFVFGCIGVFFVVATALSILFELIEGSYSDIGEFIEALPFFVFVLAKYIALLIVGIKSFSKFSEARSLQDALCKNAAMRQSRPNGYYGKGHGNFNTPSYGYNQGYAGNSTSAYGQAQANVPPPVYVRSDGYNFNPDPNQQNFSFTTESNNDGIGDSKTESESVLNNDVAEKICPKCGEANNGLYKFCTLCGEKLD